MKNIEIAVIVAIMVVSNLFFYLQGRVSGYMMGNENYLQCVVPLEHAIVRLHLKNGASQVVKTIEMGGL